MIFFAVVNVYKGHDFEEHKIIEDKYLYNTEKEAINVKLKHRDFKLSSEYDRFSQR